MTAPEFVHAVRRRVRKLADRPKAARFLDPAALARMHQATKASLEAVPHWISDEVRAASVFKYGLPDHMRALIDLDVGEEPSYTDAILTLASLLKKKPSYLEIGVSVGKNFFQVSRQLRAASLVAFDIEEINPTLAQFFQQQSREEWPTTKDSMKRTPSSLTRYAQPEQDNTVEYLCGDVFDAASWQRLAGRKFNLLFSDAFHSADALRYEFDMMMEMNLLDDDEIILVWDDLWKDMDDTFRGICEKLEAARPGCQNTSFLVPLRGWVGVHEVHHPVGFFVSLRK